MRMWDVLLAPWLRIAAPALRKSRLVGLQNLPRSKAVLLKAGVFPIRDHYYEPLFNTSHLDSRALSSPRELPGITWNTQEQLKLLEGLQYRAELLTLFGAGGTLSGSAAMGSFLSEDAEIWYSMVRCFRPRLLIEVGSGRSTLIARAALQQNMADDAAYRCRHVCIEPYEQPWLESTGAEVLRAPVESVPGSLFAELAANDILFIDSSHVIRPQGDVVSEYLRIIPSLATGVVVHIHDIFSPHDYPSDWIIDQNRFWNEQYLLEAFLTHNDTWEIIAALNYLHHTHPEDLARVCPDFAADGEPGSFYIRRRR
jgi:hypothetical protein